MTNEMLIAKLIRTRSLRSPHIVEAFLSVDRKDFVPAEYQDNAYGDEPLPLVSGATISQPSTVAVMMELLEPTEGQKILDIGAGSGWSTALLSEIAGKKGRVFGTEIEPKVLATTQVNLAKYKYPRTKVTSAQKTLGLAEQAPFDRILVSAAAENMPTELTDQLKVGGIMVIPVRHSLFKVVRFSEDQIETTEIPGFSFVPLIS